MAQRTGLKRNDRLDKFYTKESLAQRVVELVRQYVVIGESDVVLEPSAGAGAFLPFLKELRAEVIAIDIEPEHKEIIQGDFLKWKPPRQTIHVVGNPPFGRQASAAISFIKRCATFASSISFILPRSFKKQSMQRAFPPCFHLLHSEDTPPASFLVGGVEHDVPCVIQIWARRDCPREQPAAPIPRNFQFVRKEEQPHIAVRRVGVNAGAIHTTTSDKSIQSHYFIRFNEGTTLDSALALLRGLSFDHNNTVGARSISKPELIALFNEVLG